MSSEQVTQLLLALDVESELGTYNLITENPTADQQPMEQIIKELGTYLKGWLQYYGLARSRTIFYGLQAWICRRLRCYLWKQWGRAGYRELCKRGVSRDLAWNTSKSAHGPWRLSRSPALGIALPTRYFAAMGLPLLYGNGLTETPWYVTPRPLGESGPGVVGGGGSREPSLSRLCR